MTDKPRMVFETAEPLYFSELSTLLDYLRRHNQHWKVRLGTMAPLELDCVAKIICMDRQKTEDERKILTAKAARALIKEYKDGVPAAARKIPAIRAYTEPSETYLPHIEIGIWNPLTAGTYPPPIELDDEPAPETNPL